MVTLALIAMFGIIGMAVDLGWSFFVKKSAQSAADAAALAAVKRAIDESTGLPSLACLGGTVTCAATPVECPGEGNLQSATLYAARNGFSCIGRQRVTVQASDSVTAPTVIGTVPSPQYFPNSQPCLHSVAMPPTVRCVDTIYWVTVRVSETIPQLFSAVLGNGLGTVSARATAAVARSEIIGSLIFLNRRNDPWVMTGQNLTGTNLYVGGNPLVQAPGGIILASDSPVAGQVSGAGVVDPVDSGTFLRTGAGIGGNHPQNWLGARITDQPDGPGFYDPMRVLHGQPPLNPGQANLPFIPVEERANKATLTSDTCGGVCPPGNYYAVRYPSGCGPANAATCAIATGKPIEIRSDVTFSGASPGFNTFGDYVFFGGLQIGQADSPGVTLGPGRYVFAGVKDATTNVLDIDNKSLVTGGTAENSDAGRLFILTDSSYEGKLNSTVTALQSRVSQVQWFDNQAGLPHLQFGAASIRSGNNYDPVANTGSRVSLFGLYSGGDDQAMLQDVAQAGLREYGPLVVWQDQENSNIEYENGDVVQNPDYEHPIYKTPSDVRQLELWATEKSAFGGVVYQPRGAWTVLQGGGRYTGALRIITGAIKTQGGGELILTSPSTPFTTLIPALIE